jgi:RsiW-degrading membrane proteinase PrsW (M82 family)
MRPLDAALLLVLFTFLPPLAGALLLRNAERSGRPPWRRVLRAFLWGAVVAVLVSAFLEAYVLRRVFGTGDPTVLVGPWSVSLLAVVVAPVVEEGSKALGLLAFRDENPAPENGYVYGGAVGLGFAATENLLYVGGAWLLSGQDVALALGVYRGVATVAVHASATAITGHGVWRFRFARSFGRRAFALVLLPFSVAAAVLVHATYNAIASQEDATGAIAAVVFAVLVFAFVRRRIARLDGRRTGA